MRSDVPTQSSVPRNSWGCDTFIPVVIRARLTAALVSSKVNLLPATYEEGVET